MKALAFLLLLAPQEHKRIVELKIDGMTASACYEVVAASLARAKGVERVVYWVAKNDVRTHVVLKEGEPRLSELLAAIAAARKTMKDTLRMEVDYRLDEAALRLPAGTRIVVDGKEQPLEKETTLAEFRKTAKVDDVVMPVAGHPVCGFVCPNGCSASDAAGRCPKCANELVKVEAPKKDG
jgi:copper chaperone CopZ